MIEQTELVVTEWHYHEPSRPIEEGEDIANFIFLDVMRKRNAIKKGIACRYRTRFVLGEEAILEYTGEDSYLMDFEDTLDKAELLQMLRNSYSKFNEAFELRKLSTVLHNRHIRPLNESQINIDELLPLLI